MYTGIFRIILNRRINIKIKSFVKFVNKIGISICNEKNVYIGYFLVKLIFAITIGTVLYTWPSEKYSYLVVGIVILINLIFKIADGGIEYKNTFIFPFERISELSIANKRKIYKTQLLASVSYHIITDEILWATFIFLFICVFTNKIKVFVLINFLLIMLLGYLVLNIIVGKYMYAIVMKKISLIRFLMYIAVTVLIIVTAYNISDKIIHFIKNQKIEKLNIKLLLDDSYVKTIFNSYGKKIIKGLMVFGTKIESFINILSNKYYTLLYIVGVLILPNVNVDFIPICNEGNKKIKNDLYVKYKNYLIRVLGKKDIFVLNQIKSIEGYRWLFAKNYFQMTLLEYETLTYLVIFITAILNTSDNLLRLQLIICMNLLATVTQASELRSTGYAYFSLVSEKEHIKLVKMSLAKKEVIWNYKEKVFKGILLIPYMIIFLVNVIMLSYIRLPLIYDFILLIVFVACILIMPIIQLYMIPMVYGDEYLSKAQVGESFVEEEVANKMQEFPRIFIVVIPMLLSIFMVFVKQIRNILFVGGELLYLSICIAFFYKYMMKIRNRGIQNAIKKVH